jgi:O-antigen ligase
MSAPADVSLLERPLETRPSEPPQKDRSELPRTIPPLLILGIGVAMLMREGGFETKTWYPAALACLGLAIVMAYVGVRPPSRIRLVLLLVLLGYVALTYLSVLWADVRDVAWQGANLTFLYAVVFTCTAVSRLSTKTTALLVFAYGTGVALVGCGVVAIAAHGAADPGSSTLYGGRLSEPTGYPNATAAIFALALWALLGVVLQEGLNRWLRAGALGVVGVLAGLNVLCQSRGSVFTLPLVVVLFLLLARRRMIATVVVGAVALTTAAMTPMLLRVFRADSVAERHDQLSTALVALAISGVVLGVAGLALPWLDRAPRLSLRNRRLLRLGLAAVAAVVVLGVAVSGSPGRRASDGWDSFKNGGNPSGSSRFIGLGSNRYDFWRVGLLEFRDHPVLGIGVDNFAAPYIVERRSDEQPLYPHSLWVRVVSQTGVVGALLFTAFFALAVIAALMTRPGLPRSLVGGLLAGVGAWFLHAQVDWLWEMPALGFGAFALLGLAVGVEDRGVSVWRPLSRGQLTAFRLAGMTGAALAVLSLGIPWLAGRYQRQALSAWPDDPVGAIAAAHRAAQIDRVSDGPLILSGAMQSQAGDYEGMRSDFAAAVSRNAYSWYSELELAVANSVLGDQTQAIEHARRAHELNPRDTTVMYVVRTIERGERVDPTVVDREIVGTDPTT